jgi:aminoacrylate hydrolase
MAIVRSKGVDIFYDIYNKSSHKVPIFFIAGLNGMRSACMKQATYFDKKRPVILHDHRGTGASGKPIQSYSVEEMAMDVIAVMDDLQIPKAHMVGTSLGGAITQVLCVQYPERIQSAGIICSFVKKDPFLTRQFEMRKKVLQALGTETLMHLTSTTLNDPKYFTDHYEDILAREKVLLANAPPLQVEVARIEAVLKFDQSASLHKITTPTLVVGANNDVVCPPYCSIDLANKIPNAKLKIYQDGGHFFYLVYSDQFNSEIEEFILANE